jgi:hypothetical protein
MALPDVHSAAELTEFLKRNDPNYHVLGFRWHDNISTWNRGEIRDVGRAASHNTSVRLLQIWIDDGAEHRDVERIASVIGNFRHVKELRVSHSPIINDEDSVFAFVDTVLRGMARGNSSSALSRLSVSLIGTGPAIRELLERCPGLESLQVGFIQEPAATSYDAALELASALARQRFLTEIRLSFEARFEVMSPVLAALGNLERLKKLCVGDFAFAGQRTLDGTCLLCNANSSIETLELCCGNNYTEDEEMFDLSRLLRFPRGLPSSVREITLRRCRFPSQALLERPTILEHVSTLNLHGCAFDTDRPGYYLRCLVERMPNLKHLHLFALRHPSVDYLTVPQYGPVRTNDEFESLVALLPKTRIENFSVDLPEDDTPEEDTQLFPAIQTLLQIGIGSVGIRCWFFSQTNVEYLSRGLEGMGRSLKRLTLEFSGCDVTGEDYAHILEAVAGNETLEYLDLDVSHVASPMHANVRDALLAVLALNQTLKALILSRVCDQRFSEIDDTLLEGLRKNRCILELGVYVDPTSERIGMAPDHEKNDPNASLEDGRVLPSSAVPQWLAMLLENDVIHSIRGFRFPTNDPAADQVRRFLRLNRFGRRFLRDRPAVALGTWPRILSRLSAANSHDAMYHFLKAKTTLVRRGVKRSRPNSAEEE